LRKPILNSRFFIKNENEDSIKHSIRVDETLGFNTLNIETKLFKENGKVKTENWIGLHPQTLQTPYSEIFSFLTLLQKYEVKSIVDLGAGYGRVALVMNSLMKNCQFIGYEIEEYRVLEGQRIFDLHQIENANLIKENILSNNFVIPKSDVYFIYDFTKNISDLRHLLSKISQRMDADNFFLIARGEGIRSLIQLRFPEFSSACGVIHAENYSIYSPLLD